MSVVWDILGVLAIIGGIGLALLLVLALAAIDDERWWRHLERERRDNRR